MSDHLEIWHDLSTWNLMKYFGWISEIKPLEKVMDCQRKTPHKT